MFRTKDLFIILILCVFSYNCNKAPGINYMKDEFTKIDSVIILKIGSTDDLFSTRYYADIQIGKSKRISFTDLTGKSFRHTDLIQIHTVDHWLINTYGCTGLKFIRQVNDTSSRSSRFFGEGFELGSKSDFDMIFPFRIENVQDVISNYDKILKVIDSIPVYPYYGYLISKNKYDSKSIRPNKCIQYSDTVLKFINADCNCR